MAKKVTKTAHGGAYRAHSRMRRRFVAGLLAAVLFVTGAVGAGPLSGGPQVVRADEDAKVRGVVSKVSGKVLNGIKAKGKHAAVSAMLEVGDAVDEGTGTNAGSEITGFIYTYVLGKDSTLSKLNEIIGLCNDILDEIAETQALTKDTATHTQSMIADQDVTYASDQMKAEWTNSVDDIIKGSSKDRAGFNLYHSMEQYEAYMQAARDYHDNKVSKTDVDNAENAFHSALASAYSSSGSGGEAAIRQMLTDADGRMNGAMVDTFQALIDKLDPTSVDNYVDKAAKLAYTEYAFSQDQYRFITGEMDKWIEAITKFEMMYEEYLAWQGRYLKENGETAFLTSTYPDYLETLAAKNVNFQNKLAAMLDRNITMCDSPSIKLKYDQFFKPEDAGAQKDASKNGGWTKEKAFTMTYDPAAVSYVGKSIYKNNGYKEKECDTTSRRNKASDSADLYRVGVVTNGGVDVYGIMTAAYELNGLDHKNDISMSPDQHLFSCDWYNFTHYFCHGNARYSTVGKDELSKLTNLFGNSIVMAHNDNTPTKYLSPYISSSGTLYALLDSFDINHKSGTSTGYTDFYGLRLDAQNAGTSFSATKLKGKDVQDESKEKYTVIARQTDKTVTVVPSGDDGKILYDKTVQFNGKSYATCAPGDTLSVKISLKKGYRVNSLKWVRHDDLDEDKIWDQQSIWDTEEVIVDKDSARSLVKDEDGSVSMDIPAPYTSATLALTTTKDDSNYVTLDCQDDTDHPDTDTMGHIAWSDGSSSTKVLSGKSVSLRMKVCAGYQIKSLTMVQRTANGDVSDVLLDGQTAANLKTSDGKSIFGETDVNRECLYTIMAPAANATVKLELERVVPEPMGDNGPTDENTPTDGDTPTDDAEPANNIPEHEVQVSLYSEHYASFYQPVVGDEHHPAFNGRDYWHIQSGVGKLHFIAQISQYGSAIPDSLTITQHTDKGDVTETIFDETNFDQLNWTNEAGTKEVDPWDTSVSRWLTIDRDFDYEYDTEVDFLGKTAPTTTSGKVDYQQTGKGEAAATGVKDEDIKKLEIPDTIEIKGETLKVTSIDPEAFKGLEKLEEVILGKHIESIGKKAFHGAKRLKALKILSKKLKKAKVEAALHGSEIEDLTVPKSVLKKYKKFLTKLHTKSKHDLFVDSDEDDE